MGESWVRGIFFRQVLDYVRLKRGRTSYELLGMDVSDFRPDEKYDFAEFGNLLSKVKLISPGEEDYVARISRDLMLREVTWKNLFIRMDPKNVFASTKKQEGRHQLADYKALEVTDSMVKLQMRIWSENREHQDLWADFYRGRLEGILDLMGRKGQVKAVREFGDGGAFTYTITWS